MDDGVVCGVLAAVAEASRVLDPVDLAHGVLSNVVDGGTQAAGFSCFTPSTKTVPWMTSGRSVEPFNARHFFG